AEAPAAGRAVCEPALVGEPADALGDRAVGAIVPVEPALPEAGRLDIDDVRPDRLHHLETEAPAVHRRRREVVADHIADGDQPAKELPPRRVVEVQGNAALAGVDVVKI